ncbi:MAG: XRE family transcriptional regulator [Bacteroidetes bacterium]|nr:MAG: XRE family transcriptional regulator [Bacteroidota bacterium]
MCVLQRCHANFYQYCRTLNNNNNKLSDPNKVTTPRHRSGKKKKRVARELIQKVAGNVKIHRMKRRMTKEKLEDETGLTIARYESGKNDMTLTTLSILSKHLNIEPYQLLK